MFMMVHIAKQTNAEISGISIMKFSLSKFQLGTMTITTMVEVAGGEVVT